MIIIKPLSMCILATVFSLFGLAVNADALHDDHGGALYHALWLELQRGNDQSHVEWQGWSGGDTHKLWLQGETESHDGKLESSEIWFMYSRHVAAFWDFQIGLRHDTQPTSTSYATLGFNGLAPYLFVTQSHVFVSEQGDVSARLEQKNHLLFTQRFGIEPYYQLDFSAQDVPENDLGSGLNQGELGIKLFYEIHRKLVPYLDLNYTRKFGQTADYAKQHDAETADWTVSLGISLLF
ncbi:Copper resistance protein B [Methylophaga frappieri]|uniref:Copper resistance protein B n=1 Tax=Methylophaga frappieri (strain ATCC BAA-2434 / DSM 25690 / JAM7) TaxID=754477 RepID=I1YJY0_METFJ|nr:copper resistance protein B [Methylophaga frappieri]AFJ03223.1 Copper resistance protein B [Methylophaga frappieri]